MSFLRPGLLAGRRAVVTGGAGGIGMSIARELVSLGCSVVIAGRSADKLEAAAHKLRKDSAASVDIAHRVCNIRDQSNVRDLMDFAAERGQIDYLVNNAGGQFPSPAMDIKKKGWDAVIETNLTGTFLCCQEARRAGLGERDDAAVVNIIADMFNGFPGMIHTGAARAAVDNLTKTLALEWAHDGVRVNAVAPGIILSDSAAANYPPGFLEASAASLPAQRLGTPEEVSSTVCFLLSPAARYVSGATLRVDGGSSLYRRPVFEIPPHKAKRWPKHEHE